MHGLMRCFKRLRDFWEWFVVSLVQVLSTTGRFAANPDSNASDLIIALSGSSDHGTTNVAGLINTSTSTFSQFVAGFNGSQVFSDTNKFYNTSLELGTRGTGVATWFEFDNPSISAFGSSDFTLETWVYIPTFTGVTQCSLWYHTFDADVNSTGFQCFLTGDSFPDTGARRGLYFVGGGGAELNYASNCLSTNTWHHVAVVRNGSASNSLKIYVDGVDRTNFRNATGNPTWTFNGFFNIAAPVNETGWDTVKIQDHRVYQGVAKYTSNFTTPGAMFI